MTVLVEATIEKALVRKHEVQNIGTKSVGWKFMCAYVTEKLEKKPTPTTNNSTFPAKQCIKQLQVRLKKKKHL